MQSQEKLGMEPLFTFLSLLCLSSLFFLAPPLKPYSAVLLCDVGHGLSLIPAFISQE